MIAWMRAGAGRRGLMGLALLALWLKVLLPPGFMPTADASATLVICTGHGPLTLQDGGKALPGHANKVCPFADQAIGPPGPPAAPMLLPPRAVFLAATAAAERRVLPPGRRLAAPPPPAHAPPAHLV